MWYDNQRETWDIIKLCEEEFPHAWTKDVVTDLISMDHDNENDFRSSVSANYQLN